MIQVVNKYKTLRSYIYIGRGSALGNPYVIGKDGTRDEVCDKYEEWFIKQVASEGSTAFFRQLEIIRDQARDGYASLGCFCKPQRCHGDFIKQYIEENLL